MKLLLRLLLTLCVLIAGMYTTSPLWMPHIVARQLPPGFELASFDSAHPGFYSTRIRALEIRGELPDIDLVLTARDVDFSYRKWKTDMGSVSIDIYMQDPLNTAADAFTMDDLALPITRLTTFPPQVSVDDLRVALHHHLDFIPGKLEPGKPLVLNFRDLNLIPQAGSAYFLDSIVNIPGEPTAHGRLEMDITPASRLVSIRFPANGNSPPWLTLSIEQADSKQQTTTQVEAIFDAEVDEHNRLGPVLEWATGGRFDQLDGRFEMQASFAGQDLQGFEQLVLVTENLQAQSGDGALSVDARFRAQRDGQKIFVALPENATIQYEDHAGVISHLLETTIPGLQLHPRPSALARTVLDTNSSFVILPGEEPSMSFNGDFNLAINFPGSKLGLWATDAQIDIGSSSGFDPSTADGLFTLNWEEKETFTYTADGLDLRVDEVVLNTEINPGDGKVISSGNSTLTGGQIASPGSSVTRLDATWQQMDLLTLTGELKTRTRGFSTIVDNETWSGFDFDIALSSRGISDIKGSGTVQIDAGPGIPIRFEGNAQTETWNVTLPGSSIQLGQLDSLLKVAHFEIPETIRLGDGYIDLRGNVLAGDGITARMIIDGHGVGAWLLESFASNADFSLDTNYRNNISANGPVSIETITLAGGIDVRQIRASLNLENPETFELQDLSAEIFDGHLKLGNLRFSDKKIEDTRIELDHINLERLMEFADIDGLEGTGFLTISLPAGSDQAGIHIENGTFSSDGPGHLAYRKEGVASSNIGLQALENFQYTALSGTVDYQSNGAYQVSIRLEGHNPDLYEGYPIIFNLNISGSLPELFEALFLTGDFEESILNQIGVD